MENDEWRERALRAEAEVARLREVVERVFKLLRPTVAAIGNDRSKAQKRSKLHEHTKEAVDRFHREFVACYATKPSWDAKRIKLVDGIVRRHGLDEFDRRMRIMFANNIDWLKPPHTVETLSQHFDRFIEVASGISDDDAWSEAFGLLARHGRNLKLEGTVMTDVVRDALREAGVYRLCSMPEHVARTEFLKARQRCQKQVQ